MKTSVQWMNDYLELTASAEEQAEILTRVGFPMESREDVSGIFEGKGDVRQDIELTSNRGDCLCHTGLAREVAAASGRTLKLPSVKLKTSGGYASEAVRIKNEDVSRCALYTARVIKGVKVGPSPAWLADRLTARGDHPRNNVVDAANFVLFEYGLPTHVFDMGKLARASDGKVEIQIRKARASETILPLGEGATEVKLSAEDLVIADSRVPIGIAGVKGGALSAVGNETKDIVIEAAVFAAAGIRGTSRRLGILSDASYRYERGVSPGIVKQAAERLAWLILELAGGELMEGSVEDGAAIGERRKVSMRCARCRAIMGIEVPDEKMKDCLARLGFEPTTKDGTLACTVPYERLDVEREIDLIEEVARMVGMDAIGVDEVVEVRAPAVQGEVAAKRAVNDALAGMGYVETVTHSLVSEKSAGVFLPIGMELLKVEDERAAAEPVLRPSVLPSLLRVYVHNRNQGIEDVRLFETASVFALQGRKHVERVNLAMVHPMNKEMGAREMRGVIERLIALVCGRSVNIEVKRFEEIGHGLQWLNPGAAVLVNGKMMGTFGVLKREAANALGVDDGVVVAEIGLPEWYGCYPPDAEARALPAFPAIERDISATVQEEVRWEQIANMAEGLNLAQLEALEFVTAFRGKQVGTGKKSVTMRARFRSNERTLTHEEVAGEEARLRDSLVKTLGAEIRTG